MYNIFDSTRQNRQGNPISSESATGGNAVPRDGIQVGNAVANVRMVQRIRAERPGPVRRDRVRHAEGSQLEAHAWIATGRFTRARAYIVRC
jgi:hypothetical protein